MAAWSVPWVSAMFPFGAGGQSGSPPDCGGRWEDEPPLRQTARISRRSPRTVRLPPRDLRPAHTGGLSYSRNIRPRGEHWEGVYSA
ncbi:MAG: hypothetical protein ACK55I_06690 [bacterium]